MSERACLPQPASARAATSPRASLPRWVAEPLGRLLEAVRRDPRGRRFALPPARLARLRLPDPPAAPGDASEQRRRAADRELLEVHRLELAWLLREGVRLRAAPGGACSPREVEVVREGLVEALALAHADGIVVPAWLAALAGACARHPLEGWPAPTRLARGALALDDGEASRRALARARLAAADPHGAAAALASAVLACDAPSRGAADLDQIALLELARGRAQRARQLDAWASWTRRSA